jgi:hypothetical protein
LLHLLITRITISFPISRISSKQKTHKIINKWKKRKSLPEWQRFWQKWRPQFKILLQTFPQLRPSSISLQRVRYLQQYTNSEKFAHLFSSNTKKDTIKQCLTRYGHKNSAWWDSLLNKEDKVLDDIICDKVITKQSGHFQVSNK